MVYACQVFLSWDGFQLLLVMCTCMGTEACLVLAPCAGVFLAHAMTGSSGRMAPSPCRDELLDQAHAGFALPPLYTQRSFDAQAVEYNYIDEDLEREHIPAAYVCCFQVAIRAELMSCSAAWRFA